MTKNMQTARSMSLKLQGLPLAKNALVALNKAINSGRETELVKAISNAKQYIGMAVNRANVINTTVQEKIDQAQKDRLNMKIESDKVLCLLLKVNAGNI